ncbi:MAG: NBR1-Ig-like domain-containing protein [Anaerolineaceae bacterium]|nr:NBR1-Ig-like domain-containing protein [Anaerolineaceae bacterium]
MMLSKRQSLWIALVSALLLLTACIPTVVVPSQAEIDAAARETVAAHMTQAAFETLVGELTRVAQATPTFTATFTPTATPTSTVTPEPTPTSTPTATPTATPLPPTATITPIPCYYISSIADITVPDGTTFNPNESFTKTWRLRNGGSCTWTTDFDLVLVRGDALGAPSALDIPVTVRPGETGDLSVRMTAPSASGTYTGYWQLRSPAGLIFGWGADANKAFWVKINVASRPGSWDPDYPRDFAHNYCAAEWRSDTGSLPCPGNINDLTNGSITRTSSPVFEGGYRDDEPTLIMIPNRGDDGYIRGRFPPLRVRSGYRFKSLIGCLDNSPRCDVTIQLDYSIDGGEVRNLGRWTETSDGHWTSIDVDLSSLEDKRVEFILRVKNNGNSTDDRVFWLAPRIIR